MIRYDVICECEHTSDDVHSYLPLSITQTERLSPANCLSLIEAAKPAGPPPTIKTSNGMLSDDDVDKYRLTLLIAARRALLRVLPNMLSVYTLFLKFKGVNNVNELK
jgi:hypothetical protein